RGGFLGVSLFFVLSGMLMAQVVLRDAERSEGRVAAGPYLARRVRRLVPASAAVTLAAVLLALPSWSAWPGLQPGDVWAALTGAMNWHVIDLGSAQVLRGLGPLGPYWSLAVEWQFYVLLIVVCLVRVGSLRARLWSLAAVTVIGGTLLQLFGGGDGFVREFATDRRLVELGVGVALGLLVRHGQVPIVGPVVGRVATLVLLGLVAFVDFDPPWLLHGGFGLVAVLAAVMIISARETGPLRRLWSSPPLVTLGRDSYSLYLVHWPVGQLLTRHLDLHPAVFVVIAVAVTLIVGVVLARAVERPAQQLSFTPRTTLAIGVVITLGIGLAGELLLA
ncbi:MAG: hypothetical protein RJB65_558, partial [Actinomycetota bacterium]